MSRTDRCSTRGCNNDADNGTCCSDCASMMDDERAARADQEYKEREFNEWWPERPRG
jgi:hypothetical protein